MITALIGLGEWLILIWGTPLLLIAVMTIGAAALDRIWPIEPADYGDDWMALADTVQDDDTPAPGYDLLTAETCWALPDADRPGA